MHQCELKNTWLLTKKLPSLLSHDLPIVRSCLKRSPPRINNIHEWCLCLIQQNYMSEFERLLQNANEKSAFQKCIEFLLIEVYKHLNGLIL